MTAHRIRVFLADDHNLVRQALAEMIDRNPDFEVVGQCGEGLQVVAQVLEAKPEVLVLDIAMPGLNGLDVCKEVTRKLRKLAVLMLSMHDDEEFVARALENGASGYLMKEADNDQLATAIRTVSRGELYLAPGVSKNVLLRLGRAPDDPYSRLTIRERQVLQLITEGKTNRDVATILGLAVKTIDTHRTRLMRKLGIHNATALVKFAMRKGLVPPD